MNTTAAVYDMLKSKFGYTSFRVGQEEAVLAALEGKDTLVMLPTGTGKSLCYQLTGYCLEGLTIIVSPLLSLMQDQVEQMKLNGEKRVAAINSLISAKEKEWILQHLDAYKFVFLSPEMLQQPHVLKSLKNRKIGLLAIDEAHCISQWGKDFRLDYSGLGNARKVLGYPLTMALTATATPRVRKEILENLLMDDETTKQIIYSVNRPNIAFEVVRCSKNKDEELLRYVETLKKPGIVYFSSKKKADEAAELLRTKTGITVESYHSDVESMDKIKIQQQFLHGEIEVICATSAFGMGINKSDIRFVMHYHLPGSPEAYLQEVGRCGRDGDPSLAILLYEEGDQFLQIRLQEDSLPSAALIEYTYANRSVPKDFCTPVQEQILLNYLELGITEAEAVNQVKSQQLVKAQQLSYMVKFTEITSCKRLMLLHYFGETAEIPSGACCTSCGLILDQYMEAESKASEKKEAVMPPWKEILNDLFLLENS